MSRLEIDAGTFQEILARDECRLLDAISDAILLIDAHGIRIVGHNARTLEKLDIASADLLATRPSHICLLFSDEGLSKTLLQLSLGERTDAEAIFRRADGTEFPGEVHYSLLETDAAPIIIASVRDISKRKQVEEESEATRMRLVEAQRLARLGNWELDLDSGELFWSDEIFRIFEIDQSRFPATYEGFLSAIHPQDREFVNQAYMDSLVNRSSYDIVHRLQMSSGRIKFVREKCTSFYDEQDRPIRSIGTVQDITAQVLAEQALRDSENFNRTLFETSVIGLALCDMDGRLVDVNPAFADILGLSVEEALDRSCWEITPRKYFIEEEKVLQDIKEAGRYGPFEKEYIHRDGHLVPVRLSGRVIERGDACYIWSVVEDLSEKRQADHALRQAAIVFNSSIEAIVLADERKSITMVNDAFEEITGFGAGEACEMGLLDLLDEYSYAGKADAITREIEAESSWRGDIYIRRKDGAVFPAWCTLTAVMDERGQITNFITMFTDITEKQQAQERIRFLAHHDALTELPNRVLFSERLEHAMSLARRGGCKLALLFIDLDDFKNVNDSLGHQVGDVLMRLVADRLKNHVRDSDTVARLGGDEFIIIMENAHSEAEIIAVAQKLHKSFEHPFVLGEHHIYVTMSIGISLFPDHGNDVKSLLKNADAAMFNAKQKGRNNYQFYTEALTNSAFERLLLASNLRRALERQEFDLHYQPQYDLETGEMTGAEALLRWAHPEMGMISPMRFIPIAEETGIIVQIGEWVLGRACHQLKEWRDAGFGLTRMAINISSLQLARGNLVDQLKSHIARYDLDPGLLELEITESALMTDVEHAMKLLNAIRDLGCAIAIDDFGTGYSSLSYLKTLPIHKLKIDRSFVRDVTYDVNDAAIVRAIIAMGNALNMEIVAEGIEENAQQQYLLQHGCRGGQGYLYGKPMNVEDLMEFMRRKQAEKGGGIQGGCTSRL